MKFKGTGLNMVRIWEKLEQKIKQEYELAEGEWVQVDVSKRGKIHVTLVTDLDVTKENLKNLLEKEIEPYSQKYQIGFLDIYSVKQSVEFHLTKQSKKSGYCSWSDAVSPGSQNSVEQNEGLQVISFYSYKGGVGRTIALLETAYLMAAAGRRILILDLDIEAPSLHNIFCEQIHDKESGVNGGIIQYMYETVVQKRESLSLEEIFCPLNLKDISGEIFLIPAVKKIDSEYIYQIGQIQTQQIQEQDIFGKIFANLADRLRLDAVLIDTRAGFNPWGSLSLLALSNQVIFLAYPNTENMEGLNTAFELVKNAGNMRYAVAVSQIVASDEGKIKADRLFQSLKIDQEQPITIYYNQSIALSNMYPVTTDGVLGEYKELADYLLDNERMLRNQKLLADGKKREMLETAFLQETEQIVIRQLIFFIGSEGNTILKYNYLSGLKNGWFPHCSIYAGDGRNIPYYLLMGNDCPECVDLLTMPEIHEDCLAVKLIRLFAKHDQLDEQFMKRIASCEQLNMQKLSDMLSSEVALENNTPGIEKQVLENGTVLVVLIDISEQLLEKHKEQVIRNVIKLLKYSALKNRIRFKFTVRTDVVERHQKSFQALKGNIRELQTEKEDLQRFLIKNIHKEQILSLLRQNDPLDYWEDETKSLSQIEKAAIDILLGIRKSGITYSQSVIDYLYQFMQEHTQYEYDRLLQCLKRAAEKELAQSDAHDSDRLISFHRIEQELEADLQQTPDQRIPKKVHSVPNC